MIQLEHDTLVFSFPEVHRDAVTAVSFQRTLRIPDDGRTYPLPPGLGRFPLRQVDHFAHRVPPGWLRHGGVMLPMFQSEAMWLSFEGGYGDAGRVGYPFAVKVGTGGINAITGDPFQPELDATVQDHLVLPDQPWLDGYCVDTGVIRQFVAMPLGSGYSVEEQVTRQAEQGGLQLVVYPLKADAYERRRDERQLIDYEANGDDDVGPASFASLDMGLAPGGKMHQEIYQDRFEPDEWERDAVCRCFVRLCNSLVWRALTGTVPPSPPPTAEEYERAGLPWFEYYAADLAALGGADALGKLKSVAELGSEKGDVPLPENEPVMPANIIKLRRGLGPDQVREADF